MATRANRRITKFNHVINELLQLPPTGDLSIFGAKLHKAILDAGINSAGTLMGLSSKTVDEMEYHHPGDDAYYTIPKAESMRLKELRAFYSIECHAREETVEIEDLPWTAFDAFVEGGGYQEDQNYPPYAVTVTSAKAKKAEVLAKLPNATETFKRATKRSIADYPKFENEENWDTWNRQMTALAVANDMQQILDPRYTPGTREENTLFQVKNQFMYAVFNVTLLTTNGKDFVRKYEATHDAQRTYEDLCKHMKTSVAGRLKSQSLFAEITTTKLVDTRWNSTVEAFIIAWKDKIRKYENLLGRSSILTPESKKLFLMNVIDGHTLSDVKLQDDLRITTGSPEFTFDEFYNLVINRARQIDAKLVISKQAQARLKTLQANAHEYVPETWYSPGFEPDHNDDIDASFGDLSINRTEQGLSQAAIDKYGPSVDRETFRSFSQEDKEIFNKLSADARRKMFPDKTKAANATPSSILQNPNKQRGTPASGRSANLTAITEQQTETSDITESTPTRSVNHATISPARSVNMAMQANPSPERSVRVQEGDPVRTKLWFMDDDPTPSDLEVSNEGNSPKTSTPSDLEVSTKGNSPKTSQDDTMDKKPSPTNSQGSTDTADIERLSSPCMQKTDAFLATIGFKSKLKSSNATKTEPTEMASTVASAPEEKPSYSSILKRTPPKMTKAGAAANKDHPGAVHNMMSVKKLSPNSGRLTNKYKANVHEVISYTVSNHIGSETNGSLVDRGANGGIAGNDVRIIATTDRSVDVSGIDNHQMTNLRIVTAGGVVPTQLGDVIVILHQYAHMPQGRTIHSSGQLEAYKNEVHDKSMRIKGGLQCIKTPGAYVHPLDMKNGLPYVPIRPFTDDEWEALPHVIWTADVPWDPAMLDNKISNKENWFDGVSNLEDGLINFPFDHVGNYLGGESDFHNGETDFANAQANYHYLSDINSIGTIRVNRCERFVTHAPLVTIPEGAKPVELDGTIISRHERMLKDADYEALRPYFLNASQETVEKTIKATTQFGRDFVSGSSIKNTFRSPFPACNVLRRHEPVATDTVNSSTPAIDNGCTAAQYFVGRNSYVADCYPVKTDAQFVNCLEDVIRKRGAMDKLLSDAARAEISNRVLEVLRAYAIQDWQSEPHFHHQNFAERKYRDVKTLINWVLNCSGAPDYTWFLCMQYVIFIQNHTALKSLNWRTPLEVLTGQTPDISVIKNCGFRFYDPVYFKRMTTKEIATKFPSDSTELRGHFVGFAENVGHTITFKVLTEDTQKIIHRSRIRPATKDPNKRIDPPDVPPEVVTTCFDGIDGEGTQAMPNLDPEALIGRTFLRLPEENGERFRAKILEAINENEAKCANNPDMIKFRCSVNNDEYEEIVTYNQILEHLEQDQEAEGVWKFKDITGHQGPLRQGDPGYNGSSWNVQIAWENGEVTYEPLEIFAKQDPVTCAAYAKKHNLLDKPGWKRFKKMAKRQQRMIRMVNQAKLQSFRTRTVYQYGIEVPRNHEQAMNLDRKNGNTHWRDAEIYELDHIHSYGTFKDMGKGARKPEGYKMINVHMVYAVKHDGRHRARLVAGGHLTETPIDSVYSGVVSLKSVRLIAFIAELNGLDTWSTDIGSAYLEAETKEKVCIIAGPEFGELMGHLLIIIKALYGLRSSGLCWHELFASVLKDMNFFPCRADPDVWMRKRIDHYEYVGTYVDDLQVASKEPKALIDALRHKYKFTIKVAGPIEFHLGCDYFRDSEGCLCYSPRKYVSRMIDAYKRMFGCKPKPYMSPLEEGDHPEIDTSPELEYDDIQKYQSLIGQMQWAIALGRLDVMTAVMTMSGFRANPRVGHLARVRRIVGYLSKMRDSAIRIRTEEPDYSALPDNQYNWDNTVYEGATEELPTDAPEPLGKSVIHTTYMDANLFHNIVTGVSVTGVMECVNKTILDWYSKKQNTVETSTYGSEFSAGRTATERTMDTRTTLRYFGVPVKGSTKMFGDNGSMVDSSTIPHSRLHKRHSALSYHRVREAIAAGIISFWHIAGALNPADILSKHWAYSKVKLTLRPLLFWEGDTKDSIVLDDD